MVVLQTTQDMGVPFLGKVPLDPRFSKAGESGVSLFEREEGGRVTADAPSVKALRGIVDQILASVGEVTAEPETMMETDDGEVSAEAAEAKAAQLDAMRAQMQALQVRISTLEAEAAAAGTAGA